MTTLLELKEKLIRFYEKQEALVKPVIKFVVALAVFLMLNQNIGYMESISRTSVALILAVICAVLPVGIMILLAAAVALVDLYALSVEVCLVALVLFLIIGLLYFRFHPKNGYDMILMPLCFKLGIPYVMPLGMGLLRGAYSVVPVVCGTVLYFFLNGVHVNESVLSGSAEEEEEAGSKIVVVLNQLLTNKEMYLVLLIMIATTLIVYMIRRMSIENAWTIAIISGALFESIGLIAGYVLLEISGKIVGVLVGTLVSCLIAFLLEFVFFHLDYSRTERLQFEDDEYYYYVKAVPKMSISGSDKKVKRFSGGESGLTKKQFAQEMEIDEELLD